MNPESDENIPAPNGKVWPRRQALAAVVGGGVGCWLWWKMGRSQVDTIELDHQILENLPGGWVQVELPKDLLIDELAIEVREINGGLARVTDWMSPNPSEERALLQMDIPGTKWEAGAYEARLLVRQQSVGHFSVQVERSTTWFPAFALRGAIWFG